MLTCQKQKHHFIIHHHHSIIHPSTLLGIFVEILQVLVLVLVLVIIATASVVVYRSQRHPRRRRSDKLDGIL